MSTRPPRGAGRTGGDAGLDLQALRDRTNRLLESALRLGEASGEAPGGWSPVVDLREDREGFVATFEIPGIPSDGVMIQLEGTRLTVEGRRIQDRTGRGVEYLRMECSHGPFSRMIQLPDPVDPRGVRARLQRGVLEIFLPRSRAVRRDPVRIPVG